MGLCMNVFEFRLNLNVHDLTFILGAVGSVGGSNSTIWAEIGQVGSFGELGRAHQTT